MRGSSIVLVRWTGAGAAGWRVRLRAVSTAEVAMRAGLEMNLMSLMGLMRVTSRVGDGSKALDERDLDVEDLTRPSRPSPNIF